MNVLVWGTGKFAFDHLLSISLNNTVIGFISSDQPHESVGEFLNLPVYHWKNLASVKHDKIIICSIFKDEINKIINDANITNYEFVDTNQTLIDTYESIKNKGIAFRRKNLESIIIKDLSCKHISNTRLLPNRIELLKLLPKHSVGAELGVAEGDFTKEIYSIVKPSKLHLIDIWGSTRYNEKLYSSVTNQFQKEISANNIYVHRMLSTEAANTFPDTYFDWIYIDTDHTYQTTWMELVGYSTKIKPGGLILGHDYTQGNWLADFKYGVIEAVHRFCVEYSYEIVYLTMNISEGQSFAIRKIEHE